MSQRTKAVIFHKLFRNQEQEENIKIILNLVFHHFWKKKSSLKKQTNQPPRFFKDPKILSLEQAEDGLSHVGWMESSLTIRTRGTTSTTYCILETICFLCQQVTLPLQSLPKESKLSGILFSNHLEQLYLCVTVQTTS